MPHSSRYSLAYFFEFAYVMAKLEKKGTRPTIRLPKPLLCIALGCLYSISAFAWTRLPDWTLTTESAVWLASTGGLYRYDLENELCLPEAFPDHPDFLPKEIISDGQQLWMFSDIEAGYIDLQSGGRYLYDRSDGLPPGSLSCLAISEDYVWLGSDSGVARFDRLLEQWELIDLSSDLRLSGKPALARILVADDFVYFASAPGMLRFDPRTEALQLFGAADGLKGLPFRDLRLFGDELWCLGDNGIDVYSLRQRSWIFIGTDEGLRSSDWRDIESIGGDLYLLSPTGLDLLNISTHRIFPFPREAELVGYEVYDLIGSSGELWFATDRGLLRYQQQDSQSGRAESWILYDGSRGASQEICSRIASGGGVIFAQGSNGLDFLDTGQDAFRPPLLFEPSDVKKREGEKGLKVAWDANGLRTTASSGAEIGVKGNYSYLREIEEETSSDRHWGRLQPYFVHPSGRMINGIFDNTDEDEILYGASYRGRDGDFFRRAEGGNRVNFVQTYEPFFGKSTLRGGLATLEAGPRQGDKKRSLFRSNITAGQQITRSKREFFHGGEGPVYLLQYQDLLIGSARVFLNSLPVNGSDYVLDHSSGQLFFTFSGWELLGQGDVIEVEYQYRLSEEQINETLAAGEILIAGGDALQVAVAGLTHLSNTDQEDSTQASDSLAAASWQAGQLAVELFGSALGGEGRLTTVAGAGQGEYQDDPSAAGFVEGQWNRKAWSLSGSMMRQDESLPSLEDRSTEFGSLLGREELSIRYEPNARVRLESLGADRQGTEGDEAHYRLAGLFSPLTGTSLFGSGDYFDATADSLSRRRSIATAGLETAFISRWLEALRIRSSHLTLIARTTQVDLDSIQQSDSTLTGLRTRSLLARWGIIPNSRISLHPELRWSASDERRDRSLFQPQRKELAPRGTIYTQNLVPGVTSYLFGEGSYTQAQFNADPSARDVSFERQGTARLDLAPGVYASALRPFTLRFDVSRNAEDSLLQISEDTGLIDLGFSWHNFSSNVRSERFNSDALLVTAAPHPEWLFYQSASSVRMAPSPEEQFFSSRLEWKPASGEQFFWKYTLNRTLAPGSNLLRHRPGFEWYRRWSSQLYTRTQLYITIVDEPDAQSVSLSPGAYVDRRFRFPFRLGDGQWRTNLALTYSRDRQPSDQAAFDLGGYTRLDWQLGHPLAFRFKADWDYEYGFTNAQEELNLSFELRLTARF
jgi:hypothetical protein